MGNEVRAIVIADDFTGACDTGVRFASPGAPCPVFIAEEVEREPAARADAVIVIDTESRHAAPGEAAPVVRRIALDAAASGRQIVYKKIDSTLRGNIRAELEVVADAFPERVLVIAPAFPAAGRITRGGRCLVDGVPVDRTEFARDRRSAVRSARVADLVGFAREVVECAAGELARVLSRATARSAVIVDAETDGDLAEIARIVAGNWRRFLLAGSAGLAAAVADRLRDRPIGPHDAAEPGSDGMRPSGVVLGLVGSLSERSRRQAAVIAEHRDVAVVTLDEAADPATGVLAALVSGRDALVLSPAPLANAAAGVAAAGDAAAGDAAAMAERLGAIARHAVEAVPGVGLFLTGGDTALAAIRALGARGVCVSREITPGMPAMRLDARAGSAVFGGSIVTKAGGFGQDDAMVVAFRWLREGR